jgi:hypothetical protein
MMSDRERWIVYPLLALALSLAVKTHWFAWQDTSNFHVLSCRTLVMRNELQEEIAVLQPTAQGGAEFKLRSGGGVVTLAADPGGGKVLLTRAIDQKSIALGHDKLREMSGLWAVDGASADSRLISLMIDLENGAVWRLLPWPEAKAEKPAEEKSNQSDQNPPAEETKPPSPKPAQP